MLNCRDGDKTEMHKNVLISKTTSLVLGALMKFLYFTMLLPKIIKAKLQYCFIKRSD